MTASMASLRSGRVAQYHVRRWGGSPTATEATSCVARYGATIHDGITVTTSPVATSSMRMSGPAATVVRRAGWAPAGIGSGTAGVFAWS